MYFKKLATLLHKYQLLYTDLNILTADFFLRKWANLYLIHLKN